MANGNNADIGFEKQIWNAACVLRGNMDASEYKNVVLGLIFLKYISDRFEEKHRELVAEGDGFEEDIDEYTSEGIFFVPQGARWDDIKDKAHTQEIGTAIDDAMRAIEKENKRLKDILPKNFARPELDKRRLGDVVDLFTNIRMIEHGNEKDILGRTYVFINYSKSNYNYSPYAKYEEDFDTHHVIGQEFDNVLMLMDDSFYYDENGVLQGVPHPNPDYLYPNLFYQGITRVREKIALVIVNSPRLFEKISSIFDIEQEA